MANLGERLKLLRNEHKLSQAQLSEIIGISKSSINMYERGEREPGVEKMEVFADFYNVDMDYLYGRTDIKNRYAPFILNEQVKNIIPVPQMRKIPLVGTIACGEPILAVENIEDEIDIPDNIHADFALRCKGDSMINARINNGDIVYIKSDCDVNNGEIAAVAIEDEATLKRVFKYPTHLVLQAENPAYAPMVFTEKDALNIRILGRAVGFTSRL